MAEGTSAVPFLPADARDLGALRRACAGCEGCALYEHATQSVFGAGNARAAAMLVGEAPGDHEDRKGEPFVGPAGRLLRAAMDRAGLAADETYLTNAVKHFKFEPRGKLRLHKKPSAAEVRACAPWLRAEIDAVEPRVVVALGATAGYALVGPGLRVTLERGQPRPGPSGVAVVPTVHPSSVLRARDSRARDEAEALFVRDLRSVAALVAT